MKLENKKLIIKIDELHGAITSLILKKTNIDMIQEKGLVSNFKLVTDKESIDGMCYTAKSTILESNSVTFCFFEDSFEFEYTIKMTEDRLYFSSKLTNLSDSIIQNIYFPQIGGITGFNDNNNPIMHYAGYLSLSDPISLFKNFPVQSQNGGAASFAVGYPGMMMPWQDIYDEKNDMGIYLGYHDTVFRISNWEWTLYPTTSGDPNDNWIRDKDYECGLVFSHVKMPYLNRNESISTGDFVLYIHDGDWHTGSLIYREWFLRNFPFEKKSHWLRNKSSWFTSIIYQPEDKIIADYDTYAKWCEDANEYGVSCFELIGWDKGGLERGYPEYEPAQILGGREKFRTMVDKIKAKEGNRLLAFTNYNVLDSSTDWYKSELHKYVAHDNRGYSANWMAWGESTITARAQLSVNRHYCASVVPRIREILEKYYIDLVNDKVDGFQIDKLCVGSPLDFNPLNKEKPDVATCQGLVDAIEDFYRKAVSINPDFCLASECSQDRMIPFIDVYYRCAWGHMISPLRYVFPEWTACNHIAYPQDFNGVNGSVMTGAVMCIEPQSYQASMSIPIWRELSEYIKEVNRLREELKEYIFISDYHDTLYAKVDGDNLDYAVHENYSNHKKTIVVINRSDNDIEYRWQFDNGSNGVLYMPFNAPIEADSVLCIKKHGLHIIIEK